MITGAKTAPASFDQKLAETSSLLYKTVLELICTQASLFEVLESLCKFLEQRFPELSCSVLLLESDGLTLRHGAAPSLPPVYNRFVDGFQAGPSAGSCGTAVHRRERVVVRDIATDPLWKHFAQFALPHGLRACWSTPIFSRDENVLGTFAVYYREPRDPHPNHVYMVECANHLAGVAIERDRAEKGLHAAENRYRTLVESLPAITYIAEVGVLGRWWYVSPQIQSILGFAPEEWASDPANWINHVHPDDRERALEAETRFWEIGGVFRAEYRMIARDGRVIWFRDDAVYLKTNEKQALMQGVLHDITEYKLLEDQLRQSQKMEAIGQLAGGVAHDFNNLLMIIQGRTERILERSAADDLSRRDAQEIQEAAGRATALTRQLLAFSRKQVLQPKLLDMNHVVHEVSKMLDRLIGDNIEVRLHTSPSLWPVKVDQGQMEQAILNLALNARDAMPNGGTLSIATRNVQIGEQEARENGAVRPGRYVVLEVADDGTGMDQQTQGHIFEPFFSTKELGKGTGLGLASVYGMVKQSGGWISFQSELGRGTSFVIHLPEASGELRSSSKDEERSPSRHKQGSETILVVEDEDQIREMVCQYLQQNGYTVLHAKNGQDALEIVHCYRGSIHLLLTDVVMPQVGGHQLAQDVRRKRPRCKVLFTSGHPEHATLSDHAPDQTAETLQKPFALNRLASKIRELLDAPRGASLHM